MKVSVTHQDQPAYQEPDRVYLMGPNSKLAGTIRQGQILKVNKNFVIRGNAKYSEFENRKC